MKDDCGTNQGGPLRPNMFKELLCNMSSFLNTEFGIVMNDEYTFIHAVGRLSNSYVYFRNRSAGTAGWITEICLQIPT